MNFWYDENTLDDAIRSYIKMDDEIIVFYFNGNILGIKYNEDVEKELIQDMINQAEARNEDISVNDLKRRVLKSNTKLFTSIFGGFASGIAANIQSVEANTRHIFGWATLILGVFAFLEEKKNNNIGKQIEELEKYKLYLGMRKELEENYDETTFRGIKAFDGLFNINTLDNYTLSEVKRIRKNLDNNK